MDRAEIKQIIKQELPAIIREDSEMRQFVLDLTRPHYADKAETESRFDRLLAQWQEDRAADNRKWEAEREADRRKWEEYNRKWEAEREADRRKWEAERAENNRRWEENNRRWDENDRRWDENDRRWDENDRKFEEFKTETRQRFDKLETDVGILKGDTLELKSRNNAPAIFGRYLRRGRELVHEVMDQLQEALEAGQISESEYDNVVATDLLWGGKTRATQTKVVLVIEISWKVATQDVERAIERADILRKIGFEALPVVIGREWDEATRQANVVRVSNGAIESDSWEQVWSLNGS